MIIIEKVKGNYSAYCPDLPGVIATSHTKEETIWKMREAIIFHLEGLNDEKALSVFVSVSPCLRGSTLKKANDALRAHPNSLQRHKPQLSVGT